MSAVHKAEGVPFDELSQAARRKAIDWWLGVASQEWEPWWDDILEVLKLIGFLYPGKNEISWEMDYREQWAAGFEGYWDAENFQFDKLLWYAPGDEVLRGIGATLTAARIRFSGLKFWVGKRVRSNGSITGTLISKISFSVQEGYCDAEDIGGEEFAEQVDWTSDDSTRRRETLEELSGAVDQLSEWIARHMETDYDDAMSEENVIENIRINEYLFDEEGCII